MPLLPEGMHRYAGSNPARGIVRRPIPRIPIGGYTTKVRGVPLQPAQAQVILVGTPYTIGVQAWGAGGGGAGSSNSAGGGGESAFETAVQVTPNNTYNGSVGLAGTGGTSGGGNGGGGGNTTFTGDLVTVTAHGGGGGTVSAGAGGTGSANTTHFNGGAGGTSPGTGGGGGGGSGGTAAPGNAGTNGSGASGGAGAVAVTGGGPGGAGGNNAVAGSAPATGPGGGGGAGGGGAAGGAGFNGQVVITGTGAKTVTAAGAFTYTASGVAQGQVILGPTGAGNVWYPAQVSVSTTTGINDTSVFNLFLGPAGVPITFVGSCFGGAGTIALAIPPMTPGQYLIGQWSGGHVGDLAAMNVVGVMDALAPGM